MSETPNQGTYERMTFAARPATADGLGGSAHTDKHGLMRGDSVRFARKHVCQTATAAVGVH